MAVEFVTYGANHTGGNSTSTVSITGFTISAGSNRLLVVHPSIRHKTGTGSVTNITYDGVSLTQLAGAAGGNTVGTGTVACDLWYMLSPPVGTADIVCTYAGHHAFLGATSWTGVRQSSPFRSVMLQLSDSSPASRTISSAEGDMVLDVLALYDNSTAVVGAGQTQMWNDRTTRGTASDNVRGCGSREAGAASVTMSWTLSGDTQYAYAVASIASAPGGLSMIL